MYIATYALFSNLNPNVTISFSTDGGDLDAFIKKRNGRRMTESEVLQIFVQISLGMKYVHDRKILHRDLKPQNIFLTSGGLCKIGDFGVSKVLKNTCELAHTQIGTPYYMSPEIMDGKRYNSKTDIWSMGCILYELMCLEVPFKGRDMRALASNIINGVGAAIPSSAPYSVAMKDLVRSMLMKNHSQRPGINAILKLPLLKQYISSFLDSSRRCREFSHTVLHGVNILNEKAPFELPDHRGDRDRDREKEPSTNPANAVPPPPYRRDDPNKAYLDLLPPRPPSAPSAAPLGAFLNRKSPAPAAAAVVVPARLSPSPQNNNIYPVGGGGGVLAARERLLQQEKELAKAKAGNDYCY